MIKNFDLTGWTCFSDRRNSRSYVSPDKKWMVKLSTDVSKKSLEDLEIEKSYTDRALSIGIKTPDVGEVIELSDGSNGLIYEYVEGKKSISRAMQDDIEHIDEYMKRFARIAKEFHSKVCDKNDFIKIEDRIIKNINKYDYMTPSQKEKAFNFMDSVEKTNTALHGDFQPGNFIITDTDEFAIDLGSMAYGNHLYDVGMLYFFIFYMPAFVSKMICRLEGDNLIKMWNSFIKYYFSIDLNDSEKVKTLTKEISRFGLVAFHGIFEFVKPDDLMYEVYGKNFDVAFT